MNETKSYFCDPNSGLELAETAFGPLLFSENIGKASQNLKHYRHHHPGECRFLLQLARGGMTIAEVGAGIGALTAPLAKILRPQSAYLAFEGTSQNFNLLAANLRLNNVNQVRCFRKVLGATTGQCDREFGSDCPRKVVTEMTTLDQMDLSRLDLLMVLEPETERAVLAGAAQTIARHRPLLYVSNDHNGRSASLIQHMKKLGYVLYWVIFPSVEPAPNSQQSSDSPKPHLVARLFGVAQERGFIVNGLPEVLGSDDDAVAAFKRQLALTKATS